MSNLPQRRIVGVYDVRCSADRVQNKVMSTFQVASVEHVRNLNIGTKCVEPR